MLTVLVLDDTASVRAIVRHVLERLGYAVLEAAGEGDLAELLDGHQVDLLLADLMLPQADGAQLAELAAARLSGLRVLYISGYPQSFLEGCGLPAGAMFLQKPFTPTTLARAVQEALADGAAGLCGADDPDLTARSARAHLS